MYPGIVHAAGQVTQSLRRVALEELDYDVPRVRVAGLCRQCRATAESVAARGRTIRAARRRKEGLLHDDQERAKNEVGVEEAWPRF